MKKIFMTGISRGLGLTMAESLLKEGYAVSGLSRSTPDRLLALKKNHPDQLTIIQGDLSDAEELRQKSSEWLPLDSDFDAIVLNAAAGPDGLATEFSLEQAESIYRLNVMAPQLLTARWLKSKLLHKTPGNLVIISSICATTPFSGLSLYASTKGAMESYMRTIAREWGRKGIRANAIAPGFLETEMSSTLPEETRQRIHRRNALPGEIPLSDISATLRYLLSPGAGSLTGQVIRLDRGQS